MKVERSDVKLSDLPPDTPTPDFVRRESFNDLRIKWVEVFLRAGMQKRTAVTLANEGVKSLEDITRLGEDGILRTPNIGRIKLIEIRRVMGWPDTTKPLSRALAPGRATRACKPAQRS